MATAPASKDGRANPAGRNPAQESVSALASEIGSDVLPRKLRKFVIRR
jgi:hypothetical protein